MLGELPGHVVVSLWSMLLGGVLLLLDSIIGMSQALAQEHEQGPDTD